MAKSQVMTFMSFLLSVITITAGYEPKRRSMATVNLFVLALWVPKALLSQTLYIAKQDNSS